MAKIEIEMMKALAAYSGPVRRCRPGKARAADLPKKDDRAQQWLNTHHTDVPLRDGKAERRGLSERGSKSEMPRCGSVTAKAGRE
jgi:hypothetical protein